MPSYNVLDGNEGFKKFKVNGNGTNDDPYIPVMSVKVDPDVTSVTGWSDPLSDANVPSEKLVKETIDNKEITAANFDTSDGVLTLTKTDGNITVDLDDRYIKNVVEDNTPQLGGDLDLNSNDVTGTGNISITGEVEATTLIGNMRGATIFKAKAGEALTKGDPVYISDDDLVGNQPVVSIADSDDANKMPCFGLAAETVSINANVNVVTFGTLSGLDTSSFSQGDILYISTTGTLTATKPSGESSLIQNIGKVMRSHASAGSIKVGGAGRTNDVPNLNDGNVFIGNASNQVDTRGLTLDDVAETATNKHFTASDNTKLDGIASGAEVNVNADWDAVAGDAQILNKPNLSELQSGSNTIASVISNGIEFEQGNNYYLSNNFNFVIRKNTTNLIPSTTATVYYPAFPNNHRENSDLFSYTAPSSSQNTGFQLKKTGQYKVTYTVNWINASYNNRVNYWCDLVKHSSAVSPSITTCSGSHSFGYSRDYNFAKYATTSNTTIIDASDVNEYIKIRCRIAKNDGSFNDTFYGILQQGQGSIIIEYLGNF